MTPGNRRAAHQHEKLSSLHSSEAATIGPSTAKLAALILESRPHPEQGYRACLGILRLARHDHVEMRMMGSSPSPRCGHGGEADAGAEMLWIGGDGE